jgi:COX assembly protein 1
MIYACRPQKLTMNTCMLQYQGPDELDKARAEWFALAGERRRDKEERARLVEESKRRHKEWWGLDEEGKLQGKRLETVAERATREKAESEGRR